MANIFILQNKFFHYQEPIYNMDTMFKQFSKNNIYDISVMEKNDKGIEILSTDITNLSQHPQFNKDSIVVIVQSLIHSLSLCTRGSNWQILSNLIINLKCKKIAFVQDEYYDSNAIVNFFNKIQVNVVFVTTTRDEDVKLIFDRIVNKNTIFIKCLTGYIDDRNLKTYKKIKDKPNGILYRAKKLHPFFGLLGLYKFEIGYKIKEYIVNNNINLHHNISSNMEDRIYENWYKVVCDYKITLATPSGSNSLNYDESLKDEINEKCNFPQLFCNQVMLDEEEKSYSDKEYIKAQNMARTRCKIPENLKEDLLSPKMFEAISSGTVLIMYEGDDKCYSGVLKSNKHYIPLKYDYSNLKEVIDKCLDDEYLQKLADQAYEDIVASKKYLSSTFVNQFDNVINLFSSDKIYNTEKIYHINDFIATVSLNPIIDDPIRETQQLNEVISFLKQKLFCCIELEKENEKLKKKNREKQVIIINKKSQIEKLKEENLVKQFIIKDLFEKLKEKK